MFEAKRSILSIKNSRIPSTVECLLCVYGIHLRAFETIDITVSTHLANSGIL